jgi:hypothetical protein
LLQFRHDGGRMQLMTRHAARDEFVRHWLPHVTDAGLLHVISLLEQASPLLIHGQFTTDFPRGCLASQIAWHHPRTADLDPEDAGVVWLTKVAGLNPASSILLIWWDQHGVADRELCHLLLEACYQECVRRQLAPASSGTWHQTRIAVRVLPPQS